VTIYETLPEDGGIVAAEAARLAGMPLERAYEALVALEARGQARVAVYRVGERRLCLWERV
jgi:sugar-specific transcriptional regulator TrmB